MQMKPMTIDETTHDGVTVLTLQGMLMYRPDLSSFYQRIQRLRASDVNRVVVDFSRVKIFSAGLLGWLIQSQAVFHQTGGDLLLAGLSKQSNRILKLTKLFDRFQTFRTTEKAINSFGGRSISQAA
ncbi:MAG: STAS domain-containing protein [bacterium]|nr:STAS domain-containing protein [bacterium]